MPDSFEHTSVVTMRMPNGALGSLAGNLDLTTTCPIGDLDPRPRAHSGHRWSGWSARSSRDVVGLLDHDVSARTAQRIAALVRPAASGGHDRRRRLRPEPWRWRSTRIPRGERTSSSGARRHHVREVIRALGSHGAASDIAGLSFREGDDVPPNSASPGEPADGRGSGVCRTALPVCSSGATLMGRPVDVVETSRGCTYDCSFCSIIEMRGRNFHTWSTSSACSPTSPTRARAARARSSSSTTTSR